MNALISLFLPYIFNRGKGSGGQGEYAPSYGRFKPTYFFFFRRPRTDDQAQNLYNHIRTISWYLDAIPYLTHGGLPYRIGIDDFMYSTPAYGDLVGFFLALYQLFLCWLLGIPAALLARMVFNVLVDLVLGIVLIIGDILETLLKSNLRNLAILEDWLLKGSHDYTIEITPDDEFLPRRRPEKSHNSGLDSKDKYRNNARARWGARFNYNRADLEPDELD